MEQGGPARLNVTPEAETEIVANTSHPPPSLYLPANSTSTRTGEGPTIVRMPAFRGADTRIRFRAGSPALQNRPSASTRTGEPPPTSGRVADSREDPGAGRSTFVTNRQSELPITPTVASGIGRPLTSTTLTQRHSPGGTRPPQLGACLAAMTRLEAQPTSRANSAACSRITESPGSGKKRVAPVRAAQTMSGPRGMRLAWAG